MLLNFCLPGILILEYCGLEPSRYSIASACISSPVTSENPILVPPHCTTKWNLGSGYVFAIFLSFGLIDFYRSLTLCQQVTKPQHNKLCRANGSQAYLYNHQPVQNILGCHGFIEADGY